VIPVMLDNVTQHELQRYKNNCKALNLITTILHYRKRHSFIGFFIFVGADVDISNYVRRF
jgi:hypothetical protein